MVIPKNATCPGLGQAFIDYIISEEIQTENSEYVGYTPVDKSVAEELSSEGATYEGISSYEPRTGYEKDETFHYNPKLKEKLADLWNKVKVG